tara:strand:+ start:184 stop:1080 length:897 start_codon:yes stop_codon:yes gene_type:complete
MYLFITSSRGVYQYNLKNDTISKIIGNWHKGFFKFPSKGFFGACLSYFNNNIIFASRENFVNSNYEKSTSVIIHIYDFINSVTINKITINNLYDVHQIISYKNFILITETGKNRIQVLNLETNKIDFFIEIGKIRSDKNHINAINIDDNFIFIGLNNGHKKNLFQNAQLVKIPTYIIYQNKTIDALDVGILENLHNVFHTHDLEKYNDDYLISSSNLGKIYSYNRKKFIIDIKSWTRGIAINSEYIFIGKSGIGNRKLRHSRYYDGEVYILDKFNFNFVKKIVIPRIGQLNDIVYFEN